jgi:hypothetical protein
VGLISLSFLWAKFDVSVNFLLVKLQIHVLKFACEFNEEMSVYNIYQAMEYPY